MPLLRLCVYAGSSFGRSPSYTAAAAELGRACARKGIGVVYGGGSVGLMGVLAEAALGEGAEVIGVIPKSMIAEERAHRGLTELIAVETMHQRKLRMAELSDGFVALPGGIGTLEEVIEAYTWLQLGLHLKPVGLLNTDGYFSSLLQLLATMREEGFLTAAHHDMLLVEGEVETLLDRLSRVQHSAVPKPIHKLP